MQMRERERAKRMYEEPKLWPINEPVAIKCDARTNFKYFLKAETAREKRSMIRILSSANVNVTIAAECGCYECIRTCYSKAILTPI